MKWLHWVKWSDKEIEIEESIYSNEDQFESDEIRDTEKQELDDVTNEPRSFIEKNGDHEQSEAIQNSLTSLVENETVDTSLLEYDPGPVEQPPDLDHGYGPPKDKIESEEESSVLGRTPKTQEDIGNLEPSDSGESDDRHETTPITLPAHFAESSEDESIENQQAKVRDNLD